MRRNWISPWRIPLVVVFGLLAGCISALYPDPAREHISLRFKPGSEPTGFRAIRWGTPLSELPGMRYVSRDEDRVETYFRDGDELRIGAAQVEKIGYQFWKGKFFGVDISVKESNNCNALREAVFEMFGSGLKSFGSHNNFSEKYLYQGETAVVFLSIESRLEDFGFFILFDRKMKREIRAARKDKIRESF